MQTRRIAAVIVITAVLLCRFSKDQLSGCPSKAEIIRTFNDEIYPYLQKVSNNIYQAEFTYHGYYDDTGEVPVNNFNVFEYLNGRNIKNLPDLSSYDRVVGLVYNSNMHGGGAGGPAIINGTPVKLAAVGLTASAITQQAHHCFQFTEPSYSCIDTSIPGVSLTKYSPLSHHSAVITHEIIHTLGLLHAPSIIAEGLKIPEDLFYTRGFSTTGDLVMLVTGFENGKLPGTGADGGLTAYGYGNHFDIMGDGNYSSGMNSYHKKRLGWLKANEYHKFYTAADKTCTATIGSDESLKFVEIYPPKTSYYNQNTPLYVLDFRDDAGLDLAIDDDKVNKGVMLYKVGNGYPFLIEISPETAARYQTASASNRFSKGIGLINNYILKNGQTFKDTKAGFIVEVLSVGEKSAKIKIREIQ